jgi:hypothetical protein
VRRPALKIFLAVLGAVVVVAAVVLLSGDKGAAVPTETAGFRQAIGDYLSARSMDMEVTEFESVDAQGQKATAVCRLKESSGLHGLAVRWEFSFERGRDGSWEVLGHVKK